MRNYNTYLKGMEKGNNEKLFFLDKLNLDGFNTIIDFGCGKGDILKACADGKRLLIGIDHDPIMREIAQKNVPNATFLPKLEKNMLDGKTLIIFSSVLHEIEDYWTELEKLLKGSHATVVVRDMRFTGTDGKLDKTELAKIVHKSHPHMLAEFIERYGLSRRKDLYHWLLKYSYVDNWELELKENYFSFDYSKLFALGKVVYENNYTLAFKKKKVKQDYDIDLTDGTHTQLIIKLN
jgi:SAM-dependent methyltransferase